jgi:hypothetical protein
MAIKTFTDSTSLPASDINTYLANSGLVFVKSQTTGVGVATVTVSDAFSATYDNYKIVINGGSASGTQPFRVQMGATTTGYYGALVYGNYATTGVASATMNNGALWVYTGTTPTGLVGAMFELQNPFLAGITTITAPYYDATNAGHLSGYLADNTSYTAFTLSPNAGTITSCVITVYGYRKG